jgi:Hypothetical glycosyl hydrolase 6/Lacto-N-biose phosphorylase central domain
MNRREFLRQTAGAALGPSLLTVPLVLAEPGAKKWYESAYRRAVIDMHIPDWDDKFLSQFDADQYVEMLVKSRAQSIVCYCQSHVGLFNFPTKVGQEHRGLKGRNIVAEMIGRCHKKNIAVVLYTSLIFDRWAADNHPEWRMRTHDDKIQGEGGRHGVLCVNSPYRDYVRRFVEEICTTFDFEGIRFDMTFWPWLCYCQHCQKRFADEVGGEIPKTINWLDEKWVAFQRCRERWLVEFAALATSTVRKHKPAATVEHQSSTFPLNWMFGVTAPLAKQNDFLQGDFYGDSLQGSFVRKLLEDLTPNRPFGFETSFSVSLGDHTARKSEALLEAKASAAVADHGAFIFIDAIDPIGTLNPATYERMGHIFDRLMPYYAHLGGRRVTDIFIYHSLESKFNFTGNGRNVSQPDTSDAHTTSCMEAARRIIANHLPFGVVTKGSLSKLANAKVLILSNVNMMDDEEVEAVREWVRQGGTLYASGGTSLVNKRGQMQKDFMLADVFGVSIDKADWQKRDHYIAPTPEGAEYFVEFDAKYPAFVTDYGMRVKAHAKAKVLATTTLPWPAPKPTQFSSIHSNPPWQPTDNPELVTNTFGKGKAVYSSSVLETVDVLSGTFIKLLRLLNNRYAFEVDAHPAVEATLFHQPDRGRYVLSLINFQKEMPNIPIEGIKVRLQLSGEPVGRIVQLPGNDKIEYKEQGGVVSFTAPRLATLALFAVDIK